MQKNCSLCGESKPLDVVHFPFIKRKNRWCSWCRACVSKRTREYNAKRPDERRSRDQAYYERTKFLRREYNRLRGKEYNARDAVKEAKRRHNNKLKREAMEHYGGAFCKCCGETELLMLSLDHVASDGAAHRKAITGTTRLLPLQSYIWAKRNGYPAIFQVMCFNCNWARHWNNGICPHELARQRLTLVTSACQAA